MSYEPRTPLNTIDQGSASPKTDEEKLELILEPFSIKEAYDEVCEIIGQLCTDKKIKFICIKDNIKELTLIGDKLRINQILINLLENVVKFTPEGGEVTFTITTLEENEECVKYHFVVSDTGTGLGLPINQNFFFIMGVVISVTSTPNAGSGFYFDLCFDKATDIIEQKAAIELADLCGKRILLVDDIEISRIAVAELLTPIGIEIEETENGKMAVEKFSDSPPSYYDFIFMDIQMPVMGGYEAARQIRSLDRPDAKEIPIIVMTTSTFKANTEEALSSGINEHISKPVDIENIINTLIKII